MSLEHKNNAHVLIGILDERVKKSDVYDWSSNKIGGNPVLDVGAEVDKLKFHCNLCQKLLGLVSQMNAPLKNSKYNRLLLVYACISQSCWNKGSSWKVIRRQFYSETENKTIISSSPNKDRWLDAQDDWGDEDNVENEFSLQTSKLSLSERGDCCPDFKYDPDRSLERSITEEMDNGNIEVCGGSLDMKDPPDCLPLTEISDIETEIRPIFCEYFISVVDEPTACEQDINDKRINDSMTEYDLTHETRLLNTSSQNTQIENCQSDIVKHGDTELHKFQKKVSLCPDQIIRYSWMGSPLYIFKDKDRKDPPNCEYCEEKRVFEFQIMPPLISYLNLTNIDFAARPLEFGVVIISSCKNSCWDGTDLFREEHIFIQSDPDEERISELIKSI